MSYLPKIHRHQSQETMRPASTDNNPSALAFFPVSHNVAEEVPKVSCQKLPESLIKGSPAISVLTKGPNSSATFPKVVVKNTFINVVPEEGINSTSQGAQTCLARLLGPLCFFGKISEEPIEGDSSSTYGDDSSSRSEPGEDNHDELDLPQVQFYDHFDYIETPMASPYMATSCTNLSGFPIRFGNLLTCPSENRFDDSHDELGLSEVQIHDHPNYIETPPVSPCISNQSKPEALTSLSLPTWRKVIVINTFLDVVPDECIDVADPGARTCPASLCFFDKFSGNPVPSGPGISTKATAPLANLPATETTRTSQNFVVVPSVGSDKHGIVTIDGKPSCQPCGFFWKASGCKFGAACTLCHLCPWDEKKIRRKRKIAFLKDQNTCLQSHATCRK